MDKNSAIQATAWNLEVGSWDQLTAVNKTTAIAQDGDESIIYPDSRIPVDTQDYADGGKLRYKNGTSTWAMGSGWLVRDDLLVTAGHNAYDRTLGFGAATQIKCYLGYHGKRSLDSVQTQARYGSKVVTTQEWIQDGNRPKDVAFIQVNKPFTGNLSPFSYVDTPAEFDGKIGLVGYPGDQSVRDKKLMDERGAGMYETFQSTKYDLATSSLNMIEYRMSTFGGQSGGPVLRTGDYGRLVAIGVDCCNTGGLNVGSPIGGEYGIDYSAFINLFNTHKSEFGTAESIRNIDTTKGDESIPEPTL
ncbi:trypsin-like cysteine/serine peptidase domain-containing protein [Ilyonectria robusta]|uniref:trypsin-like cysteine/serine peptidase domain-containing protein n=1 Tax=Ilyonectria robusta TaxID=1079257 RepID=UPI001E8D9254|nr:trypsin-like cysteine/serine peptidase domain-containing protein [Ilyonectria robusta]KAH8664777.1 trypsin-like cysteine/serine peptidase domain-containing protein [Ilyonectria robusta]